MRVALINPPTANLEKFTREGRCTQSSSFWSLTYPPLSLAQIGAYLRYKAIPVSIHGFDFSAKKESLHSSLRVLNNEHYDYYIVACATPTIKGDLEFCKQVKKTDPKSTIILIGTHTAHYNIEVLEDFKEIDYVINGEAEKSIYQIISGTNNKDILGITYRRDGSIIENTGQNLLENLNNTLAPAWDLFDLNLYRLPLNGRKFLMISPQRGCPWKCTFCTAPLYSGAKIRSREIDNIIEEVKLNIKRYNVKDFLFWSDTFTANKPFVLKLCLELKKLNIRWVTNSRIDTIDLELARAMHDAGCWLLTFGIETLNNKTLLQIKKGYKKSDIERGLKASNKAGILTIAHLMVFLPGEDLGDFNKTIQEIRYSQFDYIQFYYTSPFPGTSLHKDYIEQGLTQSSLLHEFSQSDSIVNQDLTQLSQYKFIILLRVRTLIFFIKCFFKTRAI